MFQMCTTFLVKNDASVSFWYDSWCGQPLLHTNIPQSKPTGQRISLRRALSCIDQLLPAPRTQHQEETYHALAQMTFTEENDIRIWRLTSHGNYSAKSLYSFLTEFGKLRCYFTPLCKSKAPPTVKLFFHTILYDKILTK
jgi:hypothetical protein